MALPKTFTLNARMLSIGVLVTLTLGLTIGSVFGATQKGIAKGSEMIMLPTAGVQAVNLRGQMQFLSLNGRYRFLQVVDLWSGKQIIDLRDANESATTIPKTDLSPNWDLLKPLKLGKENNPEVTVFIDPLCTNVLGKDNCKGIYSDIEALSQDGYHVSIIPVSTDENSYTTTMGLGCVDSEELLISLLRLVDTPQTTTFDEATICQTANFLNRQLAWSLLGQGVGEPGDKNTDVPMKHIIMVAPNGRRIDKLPSAGVQAWIKEHS